MWRIQDHITSHQIIDFRTLRKRLLKKEDLKPLVGELREHCRTKGHQLLPIGA